jgi:hypothetical protein
MQPGIFGQKIGVWTIPFCMQTMVLKTGRGGEENQKLSKYILQDNCLSGLVGFINYFSTETKQLVLNVLF